LRKLRLRTPDDGSAARRYRTQSSTIAVDNGGDSDVDRLGREQEACTAEPMDPQVHAPAAVPLPCVIYAPRRGAGEIQVGQDNVEDLERHAGELRVHLGRGPAPP